MLLILSRAYLEEDASLALIASPVICSALLRLLQSMDTPTGQSRLRGKTLSLTCCQQRDFVFLRLGR